MAKKVKFDFNPFTRFASDIKIKNKDKPSALREIQDIVLNGVFTRVLSGSSPVSGESFPKLTRKYADSKKGGDRTPDLNLTGEMLSSLRVQKKRGNTLRLTVLTDQQPKADGHNNFSGKSKLPRRRFIPEEDQTFKREIIDGIRSAIRSFKRGEDSSDDQGP